MTPVFDAAYSSSQRTKMRGNAGQFAPDTPAYTPPGHSSPHLFPSSSRLQCPSIPDYQIQTPPVYPRTSYLPGEYFIASQYQTTSTQSGQGSGSEQSQMPFYSHPVRFVSERPASSQTTRSHQPLSPDTPRQPKASQASPSNKQPVPTPQLLPLTQPQTREVDNKTLDLKRSAHVEATPHAQHVDTNSYSEQPTITSSAQTRPKRRHVPSGSSQQRDGQRLKMTLRSATRMAVKAPELEVNVLDEEPVVDTAAESDTTELETPEPNIDHVDLVHASAADASEFAKVAKIFAVVIDAIKLKTPEELVEDMKERPLVPELKYIHDVVHRALPNLQ